MEDTINIVNTVNVVIGAIVGFMLGDINLFIYALLIFMLIDYFTGILVAINNKNISSEAAYKGLVKKVTVMFMVVIGNILDMLMDTGNVCRSIVIFFYIGKEGISILENAEILGVPIPKKLVKILKQFEEDEEINLTNDEDGEIETLEQNKSK